MGYFGVSEIAAAVAALKRVSAHSVVVVWDIIEPGGLQSQTAIRYIRARSMV